MGGSGKNGLKKIYTKQENLPEGVSLDLRHVDLTSFNLHPVPY